MMLLEDFDRTKRGYFRPADNRAYYMYRLREKVARGPWYRRVNWGMAALMVGVLTFACWMVAIAADWILK